jgi:hypothetical protein
MRVAALRLAVPFRSPASGYILVWIIVLAGLAQAKESPVTAILLYDGPKGAAYLQVTDLTVNGKAELRSCGTAQLIDRSDYGKLVKVALAGAQSLERRADGTMVLTQGGNASCVVPPNLKFEKSEALSPAELANRAVLQGRAVSGEASIPPFSPGVKLVFVSAPDVELAEYLRADRANTVAIWQDYLSKYPKAAHTDKAKAALATLLTLEGQNALASYRKTAGSTSPAYGELKTAQQRADQSRELAPMSATASKLLEDIHKDLRTLTDKGHSEMQTYLQALSAHTAGYAHLIAAQKLTDTVLEIDSHFEPAQALLKSVGDETEKFDSSLRNAQSQLSAQHPDDALAALGSYRGFAAEEPRVARILDGAYNLHFDRGTAAESAQKWQEAVQELQKAYDIKQSAAGELKKAEAGLEAAQNRALADTALQKSRDLEAQKLYVEAYEALDGLDSGPRALVADQMQALEAPYVKAASQKAKELQDAHTPIRGRVDEIGAQKAYDYLERASQLSPDNKNLKLRLDVLSDAISDYYLSQARKYLQRPLGSGVGLAWLYLDEAQQYKPGRDDVRDERSKSSAVYQLRSKLSIRVVFRDQTSRRDSAGFADQLSDAIASGLETSGLAIKVVRPNETTAAEPNFQIQGDVSEHRRVRNETVEPMESQYRVGEREVANDDWSKANRDYEAASLDLQNAQRVLDAVQAHGKKKDIADASSLVAAAQQRVEEAHRRLDAIPKTTPNDIIKPYAYTKKTIDLAAIVDLAFRIVDYNNSVVEAAPPVNRNNHQAFVILENVKPEDTQGVKVQGAVPDEMQFLNDVEIEARDALIKAVDEQVQKLPAKILEQARKRAADGDPDGAAESYILFLHCAAPNQKAEQGEAKRFLLEQFNIKQVGNPAV